MPHVPAEKVAALPIGALKVLLALVIAAEPALAAKCVAALAVKMPAAEFGAYCAGLEG